MAKVEKGKSATYLKRTPHKRPGQHRKPRGMKTGLGGRYAR